ncbi:MAG TPA: DUF2066 domain-containing protein [Methylophaga sp.]|nr:DUF2066 domain-containing protein [Methylophaga sp.]
MTRIITVLFLFFTASTAFPAQVSHIYQAHVPVASQSDQDRSQVTPEALKQTIIKVVGDRQAVDKADLTALLADADRYVTRYSYQHINHDDDPTTPEQLAVNFIFDAKTLTNTLQRIGLPIWGENRPEILIWLASDRGGEQHLIADSDDSIISKILEREAARRGLPVVLPMMDLEDQIQISFSDIWNTNNSTIQSASERYGTRIIVIAQIRGNEAQTRISWQALSNDNNFRWQSEGDLNTAIADGINQLADMLGQRFALHMGTSRQLTVEVTDVKNYNDYRQLIAYLNNLQSVESVNIISMNDQTLKVELTIQVDISKFRELLTLDGLLQATNDMADNDVEQYRLLH